MVIDRAGFMVALGALAAGGAGGYVLRDKHIVGPPAPATPPTAEAVAMAQPSSTPVAAPTLPPAPVCDDETGTPAACPPPPYSADESGCAPVATKRCEDFEQSFKPRVAERAAACILALDPGQRCDSARVNLCGHEALMSACPPPPAPATATAPANGDDLHARCEALTVSCPSTSVRECEATLAGMTAVGRDRTAKCLSAHCADKGLLGCEAARDVTR
jgi:hypothetical protein